MPPTAPKASPAPSPRPQSHLSGPVAIISAIVVLLIYQSYTLSIVGVASPWIAKSFGLTQAGLARLFAWMSVSAFGSLILARLADRVGRRRIILAALIGTPLFSVGAGISQKAAPFAAFEILISALLGGSVSAAIAFLAEELPMKQRARGQAFAALASAIGGVLSYIVIPFLIAWGYSWRWLLAPCVAGIVLAPLVGRMLPSETRWSSAAGKEALTGSRIYDVFHPIYRKRALALLACAAIDTISGTAVNGWLYFEAVSIIGLSARDASTLVVAGMVFGMLGFPLGAWSSDRFGRVPTVAFVGGVAWLGAIAFYWIPSIEVTRPLLFLLIAYCWFKIGSGVMTVGANTAATELFPSALRTTMIGWQGITAAIFSMFAQILIAALIGPLGGLTRVIRYFAFLGIPSAAIFYSLIDETRGLSLEAASKEEVWEKAQHHPKFRVRPGSRT